MKNQKLKLRSLIKKKNALKLGKNRIKSKFNFNKNNLAHKK